VGVSEFLPEDWKDATLLGRIDFGDGPTPVLVRGGRVEDMSKIAPTVADLMNAYGPGGDPARRGQGSAGSPRHPPRLGRRRGARP
jgi:fumarylacetoacetate (FAA) hydrolase family protein